METEKINGIPVDVITYDSIMEELPSWLVGKKKMIITSINPQIATYAHRYPEIIEYILHSTHRIPDGEGVVKVSQIFGGNIKTRLTGIDLIYRLLDYGNQHKLSFFLYGSHPEIIKKVVKNLQTDYPNIKIAGFIDGYTTLSEAEIVEEINRVKPTFLFVGLGFPKQEQFLARNVKNLKAKVFLDVGGSFDVISGEVSRAPNFFIKHHLEWLYRSVQRPSRIVRIFELPVFVAKATLYRIRYHSLLKKEDK
ncbi:MAG: WecB/TagA/CpsF family glycosyltransferase [Lactobacillales bacterium]|jgi:N-acetylglucosaminyldiphosphoundecaprenol N-acetyl-beta-D-mannosaminyltransferase|nr:WecB/TagA/CpsF family glycosyltransferase [Lactobacillales bacterium]